jgi:hypothetical protein
MMVHTSFDAIKEAEYHDWATLPDHMKFATISELSAAAFAFKAIHVQRRYRPHKPLEHA